MKKSWILLAVFLAVKTLLLVCCANLSHIDLGPDEAQYWTWSKNLALGYYSKPPGIAWLIAAAKIPLGDTAWGVRTAALLLGILLPLAMYSLSRKADLPEKTALASAWIIACIPVGFLASLFATTDAPYIFCWIGAMAFLAEAIHTNKTPNYVGFALWIAVGALFKWPIYYLWVFALLGTVLYSSWRSRKMLLGIGISLLGLLPSLLWNLNHGWATFKHVSATVQGGSVAVAKGNIAEFLGSQAALLFPVLFVMLFPAFYHLWRHRSEAPKALIFFSSLSALALVGFTLFSIKQKMQGNWSLFTVPGFILLLSWYLMERVESGKKILAISLGTSVFLCFAGLLIPFLGSEGLLSSAYHRYNPFRHNQGWHELGDILVKHGYNPEHDYIFSDTYQNVSELYFYGPQQKRTYFLNLQGRRKNQFSYWPSIELEQQNKTGYFVWIENSPKWQKSYSEAIEKYKKILPKYFEQVTMLGVEAVGGDEEHSVKGMIIFKCSNYHGSLKELDTENY